MIVTRSLFLLMLLLPGGILVETSSTAAASPEIAGQWYGTWEIPEFPTWTSNFSIYFQEHPNFGLLARIYAPEFGLFDQWLPATLEEDPTGTLLTIKLTIGGNTVLEIVGVLDGQTFSGSFFALLTQEPFFIVGDWQAMKQTAVPAPGEGPGPPCTDLPPIYCLGDAADCSELVQFLPTEGLGYLDYPMLPETDDHRYFSFLRNDLMLLVKYATAKVACKTADWDYGNNAPLGLGDMSEAGGAIPGTSFGVLRHPLGTHENGSDIDTAYYQPYATDNLLRPVGVHYNGFFEANRLVEQPYALDVWRTALYIAYLSEHPHVRVIGVDGKIGPILEDAFDELVELGWIDSDLRDSIPLAYEVEDTGLGWYFNHHHHLHISMNPVYDLASNTELNPRTLNPKSQGRHVAAFVELDEDLEVDASDIDVGSVALILNGHTILYAQPDSWKVSDRDDNGIEDLEVKFDRRAIANSLEAGIHQIAICGSVNGVFFQKSETIRVLSE
jgi:hypothetical protein